MDAKAPIVQRYHVTTTTFARSTPATVRRDVSTNQKIATTRMIARKTNANLEPDSVCTNQFLATTLTFARRTPASKTGVVNTQIFATNARRTQIVMTTQVAQKTPA